MKFTDFKIIPNGIDFQPFESSYTVITVTALMENNSESIVFKNDKVEACSLCTATPEREEFTKAAKAFLKI